MGVHVPVLLLCEGSFIDENNGTLTALATIAIAAFTLTLWRATTEQGRLTTAALKLARDEFSATHRPRIRIKNLWLAAPILPNMPIVVDLLFVNVGNARAIINNIGIDFNVLDVDAQLPGNLEPPSLPNIPIRECGLGFTIRINGINSPTPLDADNFRHIIAGNQSLCCFGAIEYLDDGPEETRRIRRTSFYRILKFPNRAINAIGRFVIPKEPDHDYEYED